MKNMILVLQQSLHNLFLSRKTTKHIHDIKNEYTATSVKGTVAANRARKQIESTESYRVGLQHTKDILNDYERVVTGK